METELRGDISSPDIQEKTQETTLGCGSDSVFRQPWTWPPPLVTMHYSVGRAGQGIDGGR